MKQKPPSPRRPSEGKEARDQNTSYTTLLPPMDEGFHLGYQPVEGLQRDHNQRPREWLENLAKYIRTQGEDVGYSIPDVLASEQQLRRLSRLPRDLAMRRQEMLDYRAVLSILLLWELLNTEPPTVRLTLETIAKEDGRKGFAASVCAALSAERAAEGLWVFALASSDDPEPKPLCLLSRAMVLMPAANPGDLGDLLPPSVGWYDREHKRFLDPCAFLDERMRLMLIPRLRLLQALNENPAAQSPLYSPEARLCALIDRFILDIQSCREPWRERLARGDEEAASALRTRVLTVYALQTLQLRTLCVESRTLRTDEAFLRANPLLQRLTPKALPPIPPCEEAVLYLLNATPIARRSPSFVLEPADAEGEAEALDAAADAIALLDRYDEGWRDAAARTLDRLLAALRGRAGVAPCVPPLLERWKNEYAALPARSDRDIVLRDPADTARQTLSPLLGRMLGAEAEPCVLKPFSDCLMLIKDAARPPFGQEAMNRACVVACEEDAPPVYFVPPLSPVMAAWLARVCETNDPFAPRLSMGGFRCAPTPDGTALEASFTLVCRVREENGDVPGSVTFRRVYPLRDQPEGGAAFGFPAAALPCVTVWPNVRLAPDRWREYYVHAHRADLIDVWALCSNGYAQGKPHTAGAEGAAPRTWRTARADRFPSYVALKRGALSVGALVNEVPPRMLKHEEPAVIGVDFGSIATTVMLRQGDKIQPASLPACLHGSLLMAQPGDERYWTDELLPPNALVAGEASQSTYYSVLDLFGDDPAQWQHVFEDGHIYYPPDLAALLSKAEGALYYDLKWSEEEHILRCLRMFLKQAMLQASLSARLWGSPSVSWRVSMPSALPQHRQEAYLDMMRGLAHEVARECGLPLTAACPPVLYAVENQADGMYFRSRNEVGARNGYLNLDIGGGTTDMSLWLLNAVHATAECSLLLGCRQMLYASVVNGHIDDFENDFTRDDLPMRAAARELARALREGASTTRARQKNMLLMDDFFAAYAQDVRTAMASARAEGRVSYVESLLLLNIGFLFHLCGTLLNRAARDAELRPLLPARMELCVAGNGGQLLKAFSAEQTRSLCQLALSALDPDHPLTALLPVQSENPKQEVALGLLSEEGDLQSTLQSVNRWNGALPSEAETKDDGALESYLKRFIAAFPQAAHLLLGQVYEADPLKREARLTPIAQMELLNVLENERDKTPDDDFATYVRCFAGVKRLWRV